MSVAERVQWKGLAISFQCVSQRVIARCRRRMLSKLPRRMAWLVMPEPALDELQPRGAGRGEVQMEAWVAGEPRSDLGMLVGRSCRRSDATPPSGSAGPTTL